MSKIIMRYFRRNLERYDKCVRGEIWKMDLKRSFTGDFEEYLNCDWENADIEIYIALK